MCVTRKAYRLKHWQFQVFASYKNTISRSSNLGDHLKTTSERNINFDVLSAELMMDPSVFYPYNEQGEEHVNEVGEGHDGGEALGNPRCSVHGKNWSGEWRVKEYWFFTEHTFHVNTVKEEHAILSDP